CARTGINYGPFAYW
nr:immunoglobulin heavy chain junction region [Mus musculus]